MTDSKAVRFFKIFVIVAAVLLIGSVPGCYYYYNFIQFYIDPASREFYRLVEHDSPEIDLNKIKSVDWDSLAFIQPYDDICTYGIEEYTPGSWNCFHSNDDGECWIALLRDNKLQALIPINLRKINLASIKFPNRLKRENAKFIILEKTDWPKTELDPAQ